MEASPWLMSISISIGATAAAASILEMTLFADATEVAGTVHMAAPVSFLFFVLATRRSEIGFDW